MIAALLLAPIGDGALPMFPAGSHRRRALPDTQAQTQSPRRGDAASLSQMPVAHGGSVHCCSPYRVRALDPAVYQLRSYS